VTSAPCSNETGTLEREDRSVVRRYWLLVAASALSRYNIIFFPVAYTANFFGWWWRGGSTNSVEDRGQTERGSGGGTPGLGFRSVCK
jgi:hypothetical protein